MHEFFDLTGQVALITGGNRGIGLGLAEGIAGAGGTVVIWGRDEKRNAEALEKIHKCGGTAFSREVDVTDESQVVSGVKWILNECGRIDTVFANAGRIGNSRFIQMTTDTFRAVHATNVEGVFWTLRECANHMVERAKKGDGGGSLVVISSLAAIYGIPGNEAYASSKGAVTAMIKTIALELGRFGIRANAVVPGWIATDMTIEMQATPERLLNRIPLGRWGQPEDFFGLAVYLASKASAFHTGDVITLDGGISVSGLLP